MAILHDNTVIPSYLDSENRGGWSDPGNQTNVALRTGEVKEIVYPNDPRSVSGKFVEYTVEIQYKDGNSTATTTKYAGCTVVNLFGAAADVFRFTLRSDDKTQGPVDGIGLGAKVVLLCINGDTTKAIIIGGLRDTNIIQPTVADDMADGHNLYFEFNGANAKINDDGELKVMYRGKTQRDGTLDSKANANAEGTSIFFNKDGSLKLFTPSEDQSIFIDHANKKIVGVANSEWNMTVNNGPINFTASNDINYNSSGGAMSIGVAQNVKINSAGVLVGAATDNWMKGTTYRLGQMTMDTQLIAAFTTLSIQLPIAGAALTAAGAVPIWPVAMAGVAAAGAALAACAAPLAIIISAITAFEAQAATYLSLKNLGD